MKYCTRCKLIFNNDNQNICPKCRKKLISNPSPYSAVNVVTANGFELERIRSALTDADIPFSVQETRSDTGIQILNSAPPENCNIFVPLSSYDDAIDVLVGINALKDNEIPEIDETTQEELKKVKAQAEKDEMSPRKRFWVKLLSFIGFLLIITGVVYLTDYLMSFVKTFFGW